jgi:DNA-binding transcriptional ArsR family regulator
VDDAEIRTLKSLVHVDRLRIAGALASRPQTATELAAGLSLAPKDVARHLAMLRDAGLVEPLASGTPSVMAFRSDRLADAGRALHALEREGMPDAAALGGVAGLGDPADAARTPADFKVLRSFFADGRLQTIPASGRKRQVVLRYLAETVFADDRDYPEKEVNQLLALRHPDVASLRRYLVDHGYVERSNGLYRALPKDRWPSPDG